jgi:heterodisulfide reductase subunit B
MPVMYFTQLMGVALGIEIDHLGVGKNQLSNIQAHAIPQSAESK